MDQAVVNNSIGSLDKLLSNATTALGDIAKEEFGFSAYGETGGFEDPPGALKYFLEELYDVLSVVLEAAGMPESRFQLIRQWNKFTAADGGLERTINDHASARCESPALTFLERLIQGLRISVSKVLSDQEAWTLTRLEGMLRDTAALVHKRKSAPAIEADLQEIMHDYLSACFPDFTKNPSINGSIKNFKPDCGIRSVRAAIEFKIVHDKSQVAPAFSGVAEDTAGYKNSKDWTRFYAVIYQAKPFVQVSQLQSDLTRIGAAKWTPIVVNGPTKPPKKSKGK